MKCLDNAPVIGGRIFMLKTLSHIGIQGIEIIVTRKGEVTDILQSQDSSGEFIRLLPSSI
jgi:hypothetical protein